MLTIADPWAPDLDRIEELLDLEPPAVDNIIVATVGETITFDGQLYNTAALLAGRLTVVVVSGWFAERNQCFCSERNPQTHHRCRRGEGHDGPHHWWGGGRNATREIWRG